jgi:hypothetical protein
MQHARFDRRPGRAEEISAREVTKPAAGWTVHPPSTEPFWEGAVRGCGEGSYGGAPPLLSPSLAFLRAPSQLRHQAGSPGGSVGGGVFPHRYRTG